MEEEMRFHLEMQIEQNLASGMAAEEARYAARRQCGFCDCNLPHLFAIHPT